MTRRLQPCGAFQHGTETIEVYLEEPSKDVWTRKPNAEYLDLVSPENLKASDPLEALRVALKTLKRDI